MQLVIKFNLEIEYLKKVKDLYFLQKIWAIGKTISKNLNGNYSQKLLTHAKQSATVHLKLLQKEQSKELQKQLIIWLIIKLMIKSLQRTLPQNNSEIVDSEINYWSLKIILANII